MAVEAHRSATPDTLLLAGIPLGADSEGRVEHAWLQVEKASTAGRKPVNFVNAYNLNKYVYLIEGYDGHEGGHLSLRPTFQ